MADAVASFERRASAAEDIEGDLAALWRDIARDGPVSRAVMSNLVVFCRCPAGVAVDLRAPRPDLPVHDVVRRHPARVILLHHDPDCPPAIGRPIALEADVGVLTFGAPRARYGVEQVSVRSACGEAALPSIVRRLILGDLPTSIWWTEDLSATRPLGPLVTMGRQLLYDSRRWSDVRAGVLALKPLLDDRFGPDLADLNWRRLTPVRRALRAIASSGNDTSDPLARLHIRHRSGEAALAWMLAGWIQATRFVDADTPVLVEQTSASDGDVLSATIGDALHIRLDEHGATIEDGSGAAPVAVTGPHESDAEAIAAELRVLTRDTSLHRVLAALGERFRPV